MREEMRAHARGERREALVALLLGLAALALAAQLWRARSPYAPAGVPLVVLGLAQAVGAVGAYVRAGRRRDRLAVLLAQEPGRFQHAEIARMGHVATQRRFTMPLEWLLVVAGLLVAGGARGSEGWMAAGTALAAEGLILFGLDAWNRARDVAYLGHLSRFLTDAGARPTTRETGDVAHE